MKKVFLAVVALLGFALTSSAQQATEKTVKKTEKVTKEVKKDGKVVESKKTETKTVLKKDGTPDKRFKKTEETKTVLKKDGTPDKRYKEKKYSLFTYETRHSKSGVFYEILVQYYFLF